MGSRTTRVLRRVAIAAATVGIVVVAAPQPASAGFWVWSGSFPTEAICETLRMEVQDGGNLTQPCTYYAPTAGWRFKAMMEF